MDGWTDLNVREEKEKRFHVVLKKKRERDRDEEVGTVVLTRS